MKKRWCWSIEEDGSWDNEELNESFFLEDSDDDTSANITSKTAMPNQKINLGEEYKCPLYPGSQICILMTYLLIFQFSIQHSLTESALKELLLLISVLLPVQASFLKSVLKAQTLLFWSISKTDATFQSYCSSCHKLLEQGKSCTECQTTKSAKFIAVPIESQIESKLQGQFTIVVLTVTMGNMHVEILSRGVCYWCELHCLRVLVSCKHL